MSVDQYYRVCNTATTALTLYALDGDSVIIYSHQTTNINPKFMQLGYPSTLIILDAVLEPDSGGGGGTPVILDIFEIYNWSQLSLVVTYPILAPLPETPNDIQILYARMGIKFPGASASLP
jgi:hypothetical protein